MKKLTEEQMIEIGDDYLGTCGTVGAAPYADVYSEKWGFEVTDDMISEALTFCEVEECMQCGWYVEVYEMDENGYCDNCQEEEEW